MKWYEIRAAVGSPDAEILIYEQIGEGVFSDGIGAEQFVSDLAKLRGRNLSVRINSPGGSVFEGQAIFNALQRHQGTVTTYVDGLAGSIASLIALAGQRVVMAANALFMIHSPRGNAQDASSVEMRRHANVLDKIGAMLLDVYQAKTGMSRPVLQAAMDAETWYSAQEAKDAGFADEIGRPMELAACADLAAFQALGYTRLPRTILNTGKEKPPMKKDDLVGVALDSLRRSGKDLLETRLNRLESKGLDQEFKLEFLADMRPAGRAPRWRPTRFLDLYRDWMENKAGEAWIHAGVPVPDVGPFSLMDPREFQALISTTSYPEPIWRQPGFEPYPGPQLGLVEAIRWTPTEFEQPQFMLEASMTNAATETAEGIAAPESAFDYVPTSTYVKRIPVTLPASRQALDDVEVLEELLSGRLLYQIKVRLQGQVIAGNGSLGAFDGNLCGILNTPSVISITKAGSGLQPQVDSIAAAISAIRVATKSWYEPTDLVIYPTDAQELAETKDADGRYVFPPGEPLTPFGLRTTITSSASLGQPLVGCVDALSGYIRDDVLADISDSHADFFTRFLVMFRAEARVGFAVRQPLAWACVENFNA